MRNHYKIVVFCICSFFFIIKSSPLKGQLLFYQDIFYGGVTGGGFSSGIGDGANGQIIVNINPVSTIKKAYLFCNRYGAAQPVNVTLNSNVYRFDLSNQVTNNFLAFFASNDTIKCSLHAIDITNDINPLQNTYNISYPNQITNIFDKYGAFYLLIFYENPILQKTAISIILNETNATSNVSYQFNNLLPIDTLSPVGMAIHSDIIWDTVQDGSNIFVNGNNIGLIGGSDAINNIWTGAGVKGHFYYENNTLFGLDDDTPDSLMAATDGLADIKSYIQNQTSSFNISLSTQSLLNQFNIYLAYFLAYTTPCDTFTTTATATQDTICKGDSVQLNATGGSTYSWFGAFGGLSDTTIASPVASPPQTTTYIVTIKNDSGCVKTEHVKIWVTQPIDSITTTPTVCGNATGIITAHYNTNANYNFTLYDTNFNLLNTNTTGVFNNLAEGSYIVENSLHNCIFYDTVTVNAINNVMANFYSFPQAPWNNPNQSLGKAPMEVSFFNTSQNANMYEWSISEIASYLAMTGPKDTLIQHSTFNTQNFFTEGGTYEVCLIAYNNQPQCADTSCKTIFIDPNEEISLFIPNVFTPNGDNENDNFIIQLIGAAYLESLEIQVFNRWGQQMSNYKLEIENSISN
ncbi:MAG: gliding motility-associated C-terminal domain-containing protein, partial [Vicingaceae bacterium]|nr:gliding motility-associated C-terminal domain-containing protein [Vicingaceae bacterium]